MPITTRRTAAKPASNEKSTLDIDTKTEATDSLNLITRSSQLNGLELNMKMGKLNKVSCEGAALIRRIKAATNLNSYQIAQMCNIGNTSSIEKIIDNKYNIKCEHSAIADDLLDAGLLQAMCTRLDQLSAWVKKYGTVKDRGDGLQLKHPINISDEAPSKNCKKRARVVYNIEDSDHETEVKSETEDEVHVAKRQRTTDITMLNTVFDAIGYRPTDPKQLVNDGFGSEELKAVLKSTEENAVNTLKLFRPFKDFNSDSKTIFFYRKLFAAKSRVLKILATGRV